MSKQPPKMPKPPRKPAHRPAFTDGNAPTPDVVAVDAQPMAGDMIQIGGSVRGFADGNGGAFVIPSGRVRPAR